MWRGGGRSREQQRCGGCLCGEGEPGPHTDAHLHALRRGAAQHGHEAAVGLAAPAAQARARQQVRGQCAVHVHALRVYVEPQLHEVARLAQQAVHLVGLRAGGQGARGVC